MDTQRATESDRVHAAAQSRRSATFQEKCNEIERFFRRLKGYRRIFSRVEKLDCAFPAVLCCVLVVEAIR